VLPKEHRLTSSRDHRVTMRQGVRARGGGVMVSVRLKEASLREPTPHWRCGLVVSKAVGNAVVRHRVQRRLRHVIFELMREKALDLPAERDLDMVIRAFPEIVDFDFQHLRAEVLRSTQRALTKTARRMEQP